MKVAQNACKLAETIPFLARESRCMSDSQPQQDCCRTSQLLLERLGYFPQLCCFVTVVLPWHAFETKGCRLLHLQESRPRCQRVTSPGRLATTPKWRALHVQVQSRAK